MSSKKLHGVGIDVLPIFDRVKTELGLLNDAALARALGVSPKKLAVWKLRNFIPLKELVTLCSQHELSLSLIVLGKDTSRDHGIASEERAGYSENFVLIPQVRGEIGAGGHLLPDDTVELQIAFRKEWIQRRGDPKQMSLIRVSGDSMEPTLQSGDLALVDRGKNYVDPQGGIYAIAIDQAIMIKRIQVLHPSMRLKVISDNARYESIETDSEKLLINGKVIWFGREIER